MTATTQLPLIQDQPPQPRSTPSYREEWLSALVSLLTGLCLVIASLSRELAHDNTVAVILAAVLSCTAFINVHRLFRWHNSAALLIGALLSAFGGILILGVGALHTCAIIIAGGQLDGVINTASTMVVPLAGICCMYGGVLRFPGMWRLVGVALATLLLLCLL